MNLKSVVTGALVAAAVLITGADIQDGTIWQSDIAPAVNDVYLKTYNNTVGDPQLKSDVRDKLNDKTARTFSRSAVDATEVQNIGGPIDAVGSYNSRWTKIDYFRLPAGEYIFNISGQFNWTGASQPSKVGTVFTQPQLSLWFDWDNDDELEWQDVDGAREGSISPNAIIPQVNGRSATVNGEITVTLPQETVVKLVAFGYNSDGSSLGSHDITLGHFNWTATPVVQLPRS